MSKKVALLVSASFRTRVVVDAPDDWDEETTDELWFDKDTIKGELELAICNETANNIKYSIGCGIYENIDEVVNDIEIPYGEGYNENK